MISPLIIPTAMPHGYNASITKLGARKLMSYRYHPDPEKWRTQMMIQEHCDIYTQEKKLLLPEKYADMSHEDGRFFMFKGQLHMSLTVAIFPGVINVAPPCSTIYGKLVERGDFWYLEDVIQPQYGQNNFESQSKNNVFFQCDDSLYQIFQCSPEQVIIRLGGGGNVEEVFRTKSPSWEHGEIRGGTQPLEIGENDKWLRFFHSLHKHGNNRQDWSYCIGGMVMENRPPFKIERISKWPVFSGDERYVPDCKHWKQGVAIAYGAIPNGDGWTMSAGLNDSLCAVFDVKEKDLNLN